MSNEKAPIAGQGDEGQTPRKGIEMNTMSMTQGYDIRHTAVAAEARPDWSDADLDQFVTENGEPDSVRFALRLDGVEVHQWADLNEGCLTFADGPFVTTHSLPNLDEMPLAQVAELGATLIRLHQFVGACMGTSTDIRMLTISDLSRLSRKKSLAFETLLNELVERGLLLKGDEK